MLEDSVRQVAPRKRAWSETTFFITASHRRTVVDWPETGWVPFGQQHLRRAGDGRTVCGLVALDWPIFWSTPVDLVDGDVCRACAIDVVMPSHPSDRARTSA